MFLFTPLTHDRTMYGAPWLTVGIIAICTTVAAVSFSLEALVESDLNESQRTIEAVVRRYPEARITWHVEGLPRPITEQLIEPLVDDDPARAPHAGDHELDDALRELIALLNTHPTIRLGYKPAAPALGALFASMWMHGDIMHLVGNMLFLFVAGTVIESRFSRKGFVLFYLLGGLAATFTHQFVEYRSMAPLVGASGAIAALLGAAFVLQPRTKVVFGYLLFLLIFFKMGTFKIPVWVCIPAWAAMQVLDAVAARGEPVAYFAHVGGFAFGIAAALACHHLGWLEEDYDRLETERAVG